jgi:signal transduction histidine kinase
LLNLILDQIQSIIPYSGAAIFTLEDDLLNVISHMVPGLPQPKHPLSLSLTDAGFYLPVIEEKKVAIIDDVHGETPLARAFWESLPQLDRYSFAHARSWIGIPLIIRDHVTGLVSLTHSESGYYTQRHTRLAETITNQIAVAIENARLYEQAQNLATLEERHRIARELHDSVTQLLYGICLYSTATSRSIRNENFTQVEENLAEIKEDALQALQEMRLLILELNPPLLQKEGLVAALQASLDAIETRTGLETELITDGIGRLPRTIEPELYRIAMEALNNLVRYARARKVTVDLQARGGWVFLEICDNGVGFDQEKARNSGGMGLSSMEQRARQVGGRLEITSSPGTGTKISAEIPTQMRWAEPV